MSHLAQTVNEDHNPIVTFRVLRKSKHKVQAHGLEERRVNAFIVQVYSADFPFRNDGRVRTAFGWTLVVRMQLACDLVVTLIGVV
jgi:hypothetical protein